MYKGIEEDLYALAHNGNVTVYYSVVVYRIMLHDTETSLVLTP
jgi:hypothetical protein